MSCAVTDPQTAEGVACLPDSGRFPPVRLGAGYQAHQEQYGPTLVPVPGRDGLPYLNPIVCSLWGHAQKSERLFPAPVLPPSEVTEDRETRRKSPHQCTWMGAAPMASITRAGSPAHTARQGSKSTRKTLSARTAGPPGQVSAG